MPAAVSRPLAALAVAVALVATAQVTLGGQDAQPQATAYLTLAPKARAHVFAPARRTKAPKPASLRARARQSADAYVPNDPLWPASWSLAKVRAPVAWRVTTGSPDVVVAVLDTGVDQAHPDLRGALVPGWDAVHEDPQADDDHGHGTAVAGVIAARSNNAIGVAGACGRCSLMPIKVIDAAGTGTTADIVEGLTWAADHGADLINLSFVMSGRDDRVAAAIDYARARGSLVVAATGNTGAGGGTTFPASHPGVVSVTATDGADKRYSWSTHGGWVSLAAPGCSQSTFPGGGYGEFCGTSSAAAFASGGLALVRSAVRNASSEIVYSMVATSAVPVGGFVASGRIDVAAPLEQPAADCCARAVTGGALKG